MLTLISILLFLIFLKIFKIDFIVRFECRKEGDDLVIKLQLSFSRYRFKFKYLEIEQRFSFSTLQFEGKVSDKLKKDIRVIERLEKGESNKGDIKHIVKFFKTVKNVGSNAEDVFSIIDSCDLFSWKTNFALSNQAYTGGLTGLFWSIKSLAMSFLQYYIKFNDTPIVEVNPIFNSPLNFKMEFEGIFKFKLGDIIRIGLKILFSQLKRRGQKNGRPSN
ncbi:hypothetical protein U472_06030 [Orenia metallireducens]|uniref:DUF2953 domain-containing protein n=1 Tax=Orenia metallireducens TaxID=1413210 RepID=A0A1C0A9S9_9FIRM|nr:DUF2953 domain-containing protein [Orenia metallireducens]OCL27042.1 hypothetical protein U472_06030 [Orenia metallireducens]